jgi:DUF2075 family protein
VPRHVARPLAPPRESARVPGPTSSAWRGRSSELYPCESIAGAWGKFRESFLVVVLGRDLACDLW